MPARTPVPFDIPAGIVKSKGPLEAAGRYIDADKIRFRAGMPEKIGGWERHINDQLSGVARAGIAWGDQSSDNETITAIGTTKKLYTIDVENTLIDITPQTNRWQLYPAFKTAITDNTVTVYHPLHGALVGQNVTFQNATGNVGGLNMNGTWAIATIIDADSYTFEHSSPASATSTDYEQSVQAIYETALTLAFSTTNTSTTVTVHHTAHNAVVGQGFTLDGGATVGGLAMDGDWVVVTTPDADTFTFTHTSAATSTAGPTGSATIAYDIATLQLDPGGGGGYGEGDYGEEAYGTPRSESHIYIQPGYWSLTNYGKLLLACPMGGPVYVWDPTESPTPRGYRVLSSPGAIKGIFVTPERFVVGYASSEDYTTPIADPMQIAWSSQADYTDWIPTEFNTANSRRLTEGKEIMAAGPIGEGLSMIWTDTAAYSMRYTGSAFVFETRLAGTNAGCVGPFAWTEASGRAFWYGNGRFHMYGAGIDVMPNQDDILEWLHAEIRDDYLTKTICFYNAEFHEVWWLFVTGDIATEPNAYVAFNLDDGCWTVGTLEERTAAFTLDLAGDTKPYMIGADGYIYVHETGVDANGTAMAAFIESGPFQLDNGDKLVNVVGYIPDFRVQAGDVTLTLKGRDRAATAVFDTDTLTLSEGDGLVDVRLRARVVSVRLEQEVASGTFGLGQASMEIMRSGAKR